MATKKKAAKKGAKRLSVKTRVGFMEHGGDSTIRSDRVFGKRKSAKKK